MSRPDRHQFLALPRADPEVGGYSEMAHAVERGLEVLQDLFGAGPEEP